MAFDKTTETISTAEHWRRHMWPLPSQGTEGQRNFIRSIQNSTLNAVWHLVERTWPEATDLLDAIKEMGDETYE